MTVQPSSDRWTFYALSALAGFLGAVGDVFLNRWSKGTGGISSLVIGFALCNVALGSFVAMLRRATLASAVVVYLVAGCLLTIAVSQLYLHEPMSRVRSIGMIIALAGVVCMELG